MCFTCESTEHYNIMIHVVCFVLKVQAHLNLGFKLYKRGCLRKRGLDICVVKNVTGYRPVF